MSVADCARIVERADPDRFRAAMAAPVTARETLFPLYALNAEISRAPWVTAEPMIAEMRLQFWRDTLAEIAAGQAPRAHEVAETLRFLDPPAVAMLDRLIAARRWDIAREPFEDAAEFEAYIDATSGHLTWVAARALGAPDAVEPVVRDASWAAGLARYFQAVPALEEAGRIPLVDGTPAAVAELARTGLRRLASARARRGDIPGPAVPALYPALSAGPLLTLAARQPQRVADGTLTLNPLRESLALMRAAATGRWWG